MNNTKRQTENDSDYPSVAYGASFALRNIVALLPVGRISPCFFISAPRCIRHRRRIGASTLQRSQL